VITFVLGGSGSGKSAFAERLASKSNAGGVLYIATATAADPEMASRIDAHKSRRPAEWDTWEGDAKTLPSLMKSLAQAYGTLLLDSLAMYVSSVFSDLPESSFEDEKSWSASEKKILEGVGEIFSGFLASAEGQNKRLIAVSDETGCGVVPPYPAGRRFRDLQGRSNQIASGFADEAALVVAGLPMWIKTLG
jgi:adenosylcobinamide kinase/adenosylcobinamide-phosphate guanylyltransferase